MENWEAYYISCNLLMSCLQSEESTDSTSPIKMGRRLGPPEISDRWAAFEFMDSKIAPHSSKFVFAKRFKTRLFDLRTTSNTVG